ncbi:SpoIIIAH-like family protein [Turicibacter sp. TJ11]|uniref:SpoIIIAH-like family protein n=1 Tax=Turicibacter sp. TJ11 TaxID=2806443 RepID=UPI001F368282|nr:SpoIIIAH-like family protein [Turicibacter sp. TJ11]
MNKNSYVTAALFVVFVLLTVFYYSLDDTANQTVAGTAVGTTTTVPQANLEFEEVDDPNGSELVSSEGSEDEETTETAGQSTSIQALRATLAKEKSQREADLTAIIASKDYDAEEKSEAKDNLEKINSDAQHQSALETMIKSKGYSDVLVRVNDDAVQVHLELSESQSKLSVEELNEIIMMAKTEFTNNPDVNIVYTPIN